MRSPLTITVLQVGKMIAHLWFSKTDYAITEILSRTSDMWALGQAFLGLASILHKYEKLKN